MNKELNLILTKDLDQMTDKEYAALKNYELQCMQEVADEICKSNDPTFMYKSCRCVTDIKQALETSEAMWGDNTMFYQVMPGDSEFSEIKRSEVLAHVNGLGTALIDLGLKGEHIGVIGKNCYEWVESYLSVICGTGVVVPLDKELSDEDIENLVVMGEIKAVMCCDSKYYARMKKIKESGRTGLQYVIEVGAKEHEDPENGYYSWNLLRESGMQLVEDGDRRFLDARIRNTDMAAIIFTSGTTGVSKGVMISHRNLILDIFLAQTYIDVTPSDIFFSVLPLHHTYAATADMLVSAYLGTGLAFSRGLKYITKDMQAVQPTYLLAVPLIYEKFATSIKKSLKKQGKDKLVERLIKANKVTSKIGINVSKKAVDKITGQFGGRIRTFIAGGAKVDPEVIQFFRDLGIKTLQGYGLTETSPIITLNPANWKYMNNASAGKLFPATECKVVDKDENGNGELCFRGPQVMLGYYKNQEATDECMEDGWFHTGDLGYIDDNDYIFITGRKKNVIIAPNGKNVFPEELEEKLMRSDLIEECMVWGDNSQNEKICATIRVDAEQVQNVLGDKASEEDAVFELIDKEVDKLNAGLPDWKRIKSFVIKKSEFTKTTALKIKRFVPENRLAD